MSCPSNTIQYKVSMNIIGWWVGWLLFLAWALATTVHAQPPARLMHYRCHHPALDRRPGQHDPAAANSDSGAYSKTFYFVDQGTQRGLAYDIGHLFEDDLNRKLHNQLIPRPYRVRTRGP